MEDNGTELTAPWDTGRTSSMLSACPAQDSCPLDLQLVNQTPVHSHQQGARQEGAEIFTHILEETNGKQWVQILSLILCN